MLLNEDVFERIAYFSQVSSGCLKSLSELNQTSRSICLPMLYRSVEIGRLDADENLRAWYQLLSDTNIASHTRKLSIRLYIKYPLCAESEVLADTVKLMVNAISAMEKVETLAVGFEWNPHIKISKYTERIISACQRGFSSNLRTLYIHSPSLNSSLSSFATSTSPPCLKHLTISGSGFTPSVVRSINANHSLEYLKFYWKDDYLASFELFDALTEFNSLVTLHLEVQSGSIARSDKMISFISKNRSLRTIRLDLTAPRKSRGPKAFSNLFRDWIESKTSGALLHLLNIDVRLNGVSSEDFIDYIPFLEVNAGIISSLIIRSKGIASRPCSNASKVNTSNAFI